MEIQYIPVANPSDRPFELGLKPDGDDTQGLMAEVIEHGYSNLPRSDLEAIAVYLKSIPAIDHELRKE